MVVAAPMNEEELRNLMYTAQLEKNKFPFSIRYPRGNGVMTNWKTPFKEIKIGTGRKVKNGEDLAILSIGHIGNYALEACNELTKKGINAALYDMRFVKPLDEILLHEIFSKYTTIITLENGCIIGGLGSAVLEFMADNDYSATVKRLGIPDEFIEHGTQDELYAECGFDVNGIIQTAVHLLEQKKSNKALA
jgi:1-deoxy-D-xylulose-5-phosphate synthase